MKRLMRQINKARAILSGTRGDSLMEGVVSILVFSILAAAVSMMIITALRMTSIATRNATDSQNAFNAVIGNAAGVPEDDVVEFEIDGNPVEVSVNIYSDDAGIFTAFAP